MVGISVVMVSSASESASNSPGIFDTSQIILSPSAVLGIVQDISVGSRMLVLSKTPRRWYATVDAGGRRSSNDENEGMSGGG
jgi:hypothetical protein